MTDTLNKLEQLIGVKFKDKELLKKSLIHKSKIINEKKKN